MQKYVEYCKKSFKKKIEFFNKTKIKYEFLTAKNLKIHILLKNSNIFRRNSYNIINFSIEFYI